MLKLHAEEPQILRLGLPHASTKRFQPPSKQDIAGTSLTNTNAIQRPSSCNSEAGSNWLQYSIVVILISTSLSHRAWLSLLAMICKNNFAVPCRGNQAKKWEPPNQCQSSRKRPYVNSATSANAESTAKQMHAHKYSTYSL